MLYCKIIVNFLFHNFIEEIGYIYQYHPLVSEILKQLFLYLQLELTKLVWPSGLVRGTRNWSRDGFVKTVAKKFGSKKFAHIARRAYQALGLKNQGFSD